MSEHVEWSDTEAPTPSAPAAVTPADAADAARLVAFGLQPKLQPARDQEYAELLRRYREDPPFARLADAVAAGLGLVVLEVSPRAGMAVTAAEDSVFAVRMGDYARRTSADGGDRFLHGLAHLAVAAMAFPGPRTSPTTDTSGASRSTASTPSYDRPADGWRSGPRRSARTPTRPRTRRASSRPGGSGPDAARRRDQGRAPARRVHDRHRGQGRRLPHRLRVPAAHR